MINSAETVSINSKLEIFEPLKITIQIAMDKGESAEAVTDKIMHLLDRHHLVTYAKPNQVQLLNSHGRVLIAIIEDSGITQRALSKYIGVSESNINHSVKLLLKNKLITKTKVRNRNTYSFNFKEGLNHPDISRFLDTLMPEVKKYVEETERYTAPEVVAPE